jgi:hypothetical protein
MACQHHLAIGADLVPQELEMMTDLCPRLLKIR